MKRTQIYIDDDTYEYLRKESEARHVTLSEVIRQSIREKMNKKVRKALKAVDGAFGVWKNREFEVEKHIEDMRKDRKAW